MLYHGAYLSNYMNWLKDPGDYFPSAHLVWTDIGIAQHILNSDTFSPYQGIYHIWNFQSLAFFRNSINSSFEICMSCFTDRYSIITCFILFLLPYLCSSSQLSHYLSSLHTLLWVKFYKLVWASNSHIHTTQQDVRFRNRSSICPMPTRFIVSRFNRNISSWI